MEEEEVERGMGRKELLGNNGRINTRMEDKNCENCDSRKNFLTDYNWFSPSLLHSILCVLLFINFPTIKKSLNTYNAPSYPSLCLYLPGFCANYFRALYLFNTYVHGLFSNNSSNSSNIIFFYCFVECKC